MVLRGKATDFENFKEKNIPNFTFYRTGNNTVMGRINRLTSSGEQKETLIQKEISRFVRIIVSLTIVLVSILLTEWLVYVKDKTTKFYQHFLHFDSFLGS